MSRAPSAARRDADNLHLLHRADRAFGRARHTALRVLLAVAAVQLAALVAALILLTTQKVLP